MEKDEVLFEILKYFRSYRFLSLNAIKAHIYSILEGRKKVGTITKGTPDFNITTYVEMSQKDIQHIHVVIWDLIIERIITPINTDSNDIMSNLVVTDMPKLESKLVELLSHK